MFKTLTAADHVMAIAFSGKMTRDDVRQYRKAFEDKLAKHAHISAYIDLNDASDLSADALVEGMEADLELFSHLDQFSRYALVSDKEWPRAAISWMARVFPNIEMKVFTSAQSDEALKWASEHPEVPKTKAPAIRFLATTKDNVFAFEINGVISADEMPGVVKKFDAFLASHDKVRLLNRMKHFGGIDPAVFMQSGLVSMKLAAMQKVERYAIVGAPNWMRKIVETLNPAFADIDMRTFPADQEADAWTWLEAEPAKGN